MKRRDNIPWFFKSYSKKNRGVPAPTPPPDEGYFACPTSGLAIYKDYNFCVPQIGHSRQRFSRMPLILIPSTRRNEFLICDFCITLCVHSVALVKSVISRVRSTESRKYSSSNVKVLYTSLQTVDCSLSIFNCTVQYLYSNDLGREFPRKIYPVGCRYEIFDIWQYLLINQ
jgi:hypothetical protein